MTRFTANIAFLFPELPFLDRIDAAKAAGFERVECHFPYEFPIEVLRDRLTGAGVQLTGLNTQPGDRARGERHGDGALFGRAIRGRPQPPAPAGRLHPRRGRPTAARTQVRAREEHVDRTLRLIRRRNQGTDAATQSSALRHHLSLLCVATRDATSTAVSRYATAPADCALQIQ